MSKEPWFGKALPLTDGAFEAAAKKLRCEVVSIQAVYMAESSGKPYRRDGSVERRFEPHKMPGATIGWRDSFKIGRSRREAMFASNYTERPIATMEATSWHGPQIMGFNCKMAGYPNVVKMVRDMADREDAGVEAFVAFVVSANLDTHLRAKDWLSFAKGYNGTGQASTYARIIRGHYGAKAHIAEKVYRQVSGQRSPAVIRKGSRGEAVFILQRALEARGFYRMSIDGVFGIGTDRAVRQYQEKMGLVVDGVVGAMTWEKLLPEAWPTK